ncbi:dihydrodipicolinate synthase family protein [Falsihalocynthiibacter sp. S25ZX9]|uniref:dihydrodipicolinate synthase family protein n=1 Tax=Falsihalocynthiibacter sp. S25ZX9 TaxID=3240870 RepID=UPI00350EA191
MKKTRIFGLSAALVTPFGPTGDPDLTRVVSHAKFVISGGCDSVTLFGTTGEGFGLSSHERRDILKAVSGALSKDTPIGVGILTCDIATAAEQALSAYAGGASRLLMAPPFFMKNMGDDGLFAWYSAVFDRIGDALKNVILYHIPSQTAVPISVELVSRLRAAYPGVITGIKDSSGDWDTTQKYLAAHGDISILVGDERQLPKAMANGAEGSICGVSNFLPGLLRKIIHEGADARLLSGIVDMVVAGPVTPSVKVLTAHVSGDPDFIRVRPPLSQLPESAQKALIQGYEAAMAKG